MKKIIVFLMISVFLIAGCGEKTETIIAPPVETAVPAEPAPTPAPESTVPQETETPSTSTQTQADEAYPSVPDIHAPDIQENVKIMTGSVKFNKYGAKAVEEGGYIFGEVGNIGKVTAKNIQVYAVLYYNREERGRGSTFIEEIGVGQVTDFGFTFPVSGEFNSYLISFEKIGELRETKVIIE